MKHFILILIFILCGSFTFISEKDYCKGWEDGYIAGWDYAYGATYPSSLVPIPPCPLPEDPLMTDYKHGYSRAFLVVMEKIYEDNFSYQR